LLLAVCHTGEADEGEAMLFEERLMKEESKIF